MFSDHLKKPFGILYILEGIDDELYIVQLHVNVDLLNRYSLAFILKPLLSNATEKAKTIIINNNNNTILEGLENTFKVLFNFYILFGAFLTFCSLPCTFFIFCVEAIYLAQLYCHHFTPGGVSLIVSKSCFCYIDYNLPYKNTVHILLYFPDI